MKRAMVHNTVAQGSVFVFGLLNAILSAQVLGTEGKGQLAIYLLAIDMGVVLMILGLGQAIQYYGARKEYRGPKLLGTAVVYSLACTALFALMVQTLFWMGQGGRVLPPPFDTPAFRVIIALHFLHQFLGHLLIGLINSHKLFVETSRIQVGTTILTASMYLAVFVVQRTGSHEIFASAFYVALTVSAVVRIWMALFVYFRHIHAGETLTWGLLDAPRARTLLAFGVFPWMSGFLLRAVQKVDFWFVQHYEGLDVLGLYSVASNLGETLYLLPNTIGLVLLSYAADPESRNDSTERTATIARLFFPTMVVGALAFSLVSAPFFGLAFGPSFRASGALFNILMLGTVPFSLATLMMGYLTGIRQVRHILAASAVGLGALLILDGLLVPRFGANGAAGARALAFNAMTWYLVILFTRATGIRLRDTLFPRAGDLSLLKRALASSRRPRTSPRDRNGQG